MPEALVVMVLFKLGRIVAWFVAPIGGPVSNPSHGGKAICIVRPSRTYGHRPIATRPSKIWMVFGTGPGLRVSFAQFYY